MPDNYNPGREQVQVTASPNIITERARFDPQGSANRLIQALGADSTQRELANFNQQYEQKKLTDQAAKVDWYIEQFSQDHAGGAVSQAQVKQRFPETVPVIAARVAEGIGQQEGRKKFQSVIDEIANDDSLRLDSTKRAAFLAQKRAEITQQIGSGNDFYGAGIVQAMNRMQNQYEANWATETAAYHQKVQADQFSGEVVDAINSGDPKALLALDQKYATSSSLNNLERNKIVVNSAIDQAFVSDDPKVLQAIPQRFLNVDSKAALEKARVQLQDRRMSDFRNAQELRKARQQDDSRARKLSIVDDVVNGKKIDPGVYRDDPDAFQFALQMREAPRIDESTSTSNAQSIRNLILNQSTMGGRGSMGDLQDQIAANPNLNPADRKKLLDDLPKLVEGRDILADPRVSEAMSARLMPRLQSLEQSTNSALQTMLSGRNLRAETMNSFQVDVRRYFRAFYEKNGDWPRGMDAEDLVDRATERAEKVIEHATSNASIKEYMDAQRATASGAPASAPKAAPAAAPKPLPKGVTKLD